MPKLTVVECSRDEITINACEGVTVIEAIRDNGFDEPMALRAVIAAED